MAASTHIFDAEGERIELELVDVALPGMLEQGAGVPTGEVSTVEPVVRAARGFFELGLRTGVTGPVHPAKKGPPPVVLRERRSGLLRSVYREVVVRFRAGTTDRTRRQLLKKYGLSIKRVNPLVPDQVVAADPSRSKGGADLIDVANDCFEADEVLFATPNFVSQFRREASVAIPPEQWHLENLARVRGQKRDEDIDALDAWSVTQGRPSVIVAVLDDGVDIDHPNLKARIWRNPDRAARDRNGRDFFLPDGHPDHFNPRPKRFAFPFTQLQGNDIHGTPCAGVIVAAGNGAFGAAFRCRVLPVKIFHADALAPDERVADAIRYAATRAAILSNSWSGPVTPDIELALRDAQRGRNGRGCAIFCAAGNENGSPIGFPASSSDAIAVAASTDQARRASYSNVGPQMDLCAPSSGGKQGIFTTDVSRPPGRGFNVGDDAAGGADGLHTNSFGGTSSATPLAAAVGALVLSVNSRLSSAELRTLLCETADKIGTGYDARGFSPEFGFGRVNAGRAVRAAQALR